ncbi:MAG: CvpA family protein [Proteobacteria bacterium]|nr:CvpA family protein [Pseudomonadota bacterium]MBI3497835.1 CvpA family protein [Pseudomonadota bacterium]
MSQFALTAADIAVVAIVLISGLLAFFRGFVREVLSVAGWIGAAAAALYGFRPLQPIIRKLVGYDLPADVLTGAGLFIVALIVLSMLSHAISVRVKDSALSAVDRSLGFIFGLIRGAVIVCIAYLAVNLAFPKDSQPDWLRNAKSMPAVERGATLLLSLIPREVRSQGASAADEARRRAADAAEARKAYERLVSPSPKAPEAKADAPADATGYKPGERRELDRLIQTTQ